MGRRCFPVLLPVNVFGQSQQHIRTMVVASVWECYFLCYGFELCAFVTPHAAWLLFWRLSSHGPCPTKPRSTRIVWGAIISVTCVLLTFWVYKVCVLAVHCVILCMASGPFFLCSVTGFFWLLTISGFIFLVGFFTFLTLAWFPNLSGLSFFALSNEIRNIN